MVGVGPKHLCLHTVWLTVSLQVTHPTEVQQCSIEDACPQLWLHVSVSSSKDLAFGRTTQMIQICSQAENHCFIED